MDRLIPLSRLADGFPRSGGRAGLAYAQSVHFVQYLRQRLGAEGFRRLLASLGTHRGDVPAALSETLGVSSARISVEWHDHLRVRWGWLPIIFSETSLWIFASLLLLLGWWRRRTQARVKLDLMRREEEQNIEGAIDIRSESQTDQGSLDPYDGRPPTFH